MGLLKTNELIPEMKDPILKLKEGDISQVIETKEGMHILKRGKLLVKQANMQLRDAVFNQARKEYPQPISDNKLEEWRLRLQTKKNK